MAASAAQQAQPGKGFLELHSMYIHGCEKFAIRPYTPLIHRPRYFSRCAGRAEGVEREETYCLLILQASRAHPRYSTKILWGLLFFKSRAGGATFFLITLLMTGSAVCTMNFMDLFAKIM